MMGKRKPNMPTEKNKHLKTMTCCKKKKKNTVTRGKQRDSLGSTMRYKISCILKHTFF